MAYSIIALQELNLNYKWNPIYWQTGYLLCESGAYDEEANDSTKYGKVGTAISRIQKEGVTIANPDINTAEFGFVPDEDNNRIIFSLKGINAISTDLAQEIIKNRPYTSFEDFCTRMIETKKVQNSQMLMLIKAGCFLNLDSQDREETMRKYLKKYQYNPTEKLTLAQMNAIQEYDIIPENLKICVRYLNFKKYVLSPEGFVENYVDNTKKIPKVGYHDRYFILDEQSQEFFTEHFTEESIVRVQNGFYVVSEKKFLKEIDTKLQPLKDWFESDEAVKAYNTATFRSIWNKHASGSEAKWSMQALTYYDQKQELDGVDEQQYDIINFFDMPEEPESYETYTKWVNGEPKQLPKYTIHRIAGVVLNADNNHHTVSILTKNGVVDVKMYKESYAHYNRRISVSNGKGSKTVVEEPWFKRGTLLCVAGFRRGDQWVPRVYTDSVFKHTINKITSVNPDGTLELQLERVKV